ncbi:Helicase associated domain protein [Streptomyces sp. NPDC001093]|uniref:Helicase associated domain protein n=1 Tax=Streptomyces sp. NPDC001093 TaxID=3154376 RepID=UPI003326B76C
MAHQQPPRTRAHSTTVSGERPAASGILVTALASGAAGRVAPLQDELTLSFLTRLAARYHLSPRDLLAAVTETDGLQNLTGMLCPDSEIHLNAQARARIATLCRVEPQVLERALPAWMREEPCGKYGAGPVGRLMRGEQAVAAWGPACPGCTSARTGRLMSARRYLAPEQRVCPRHRYWLMYLPHTSGLSVPLARCPEVVEAHGRHVRLLRHGAVGAQAFEVARAVAGAWWQQSWPAEEMLWPNRLAATCPEGADPSWWQAAARDLITYPETVALARLLADRSLQQRTVTESGRHLPYRLGELPRLLTELADRLGRPWLARHLAADTHGPLFTWIHSCVRTRAASTRAAQKVLWRVHSTHRPRALSDLLPRPPAAGTAQPMPPPVKRLRGHSVQAERAFEQGVAHARLFHQQHGHLAVPKDATLGGYPLGTWLVNQRARHLRMPDHHFMALAALDPWWNPPWDPRWRRQWHQAAQHTRAHGPLNAASGFPDTGINLAEWLYEQCARYADLHPEQQRLMASLGIDTATAQAARPPRRSYSERFQMGLAHAAAYASQHGQLANVGQRTVHDGFPLGNWLALLRNRHHNRPPVPADRVQALNALDPWWNPPWSLYWQRHYYRARDMAAGHTLNPSNGFDDLPDAAVADWLRRQCRDYHHLHPNQQQLLTAVGLTPDTVDTARRHLTTRTGTARNRHRAKNGSLLGHRPDQRAGFDAALAHARSHAAQHGHLAVPGDTLHDGFPLGRWLARQRNQASTRARRNLPPSPQTGELAAIDPWWNPPWKSEWQRNYYRALHHIHAGKPFNIAHRRPNSHTALGSWIDRACCHYDRLHPGQQQLLTSLGITPEALAARTGIAPHWHTAIEHARSYAAQHGHLAAPHHTLHDGFALGRWLVKQRYRTRTGTSCPAAGALTAIDPWWNPPWNLRWQRAYHHARTHPHTHASRQWLNNQRAAWPRLHPDQQRLLTHIGVTG